MSGATTTSPRPASASWCSACSANVSSGSFETSPRHSRARSESSPAARGESQELDFKRERLRELGRLAKLGETLLTALVAGKTVDPTPILKVYEDS